MIAEEAIEILKIERNHMTPTLLTERIKAMDMAISALERRIPKETIKPASPYCKYACPICGNYPLSGHYCGECGQAIVYRKEGEG